MFSVKYCKQIFWEVGVTPNIFQRQGGSFQRNVAFFQKFIAEEMSPIRS